jgi:hypothetical protein
VMLPHRQTAGMLWQVRNKSSSWSMLILTCCYFNLTFMFPLSWTPMLRQPEECAVCTCKWQALSVSVCRTWQFWSNWELICSYKSVDLFLHKYFPWKMITKENCVFSWSLENKHGNYCVKSHFSHTFFSHITVVSHCPI